MGLGPRGGKRMKNETWTVKVFKFTGVGGHQPTGETLLAGAAEADALTLAKAWNLEQKREGEKTGFAMTEGSLYAMCVPDTTGDDDAVREAVRHARDAACRNEDNPQCAIDHVRLAEWLEELLRLRKEKTKE